MWSTNWEAVAIFAALATQWRVVGVGPILHHVGLDYGEVDLMISRFAADPAVFWDVQVMEAAALPILNEADR